MELLLEPGWQARFWGYVSIPEDQAQCWLWTGTLRPDGYGVLGVGAGLERAHRLSWLLHRGEIPAGKFVCHRCDTPACVNPEHLFLGSHTENMRDMINKGRARHPGTRGLRNGNAKLSEEAKQAIRVAAQGLPNRRRGRIAFWKELAGLYGVSYRHAQDIGQKGGCHAGTVTGAR